MTSRLSVGANGVVVDNTSNADDRAAWFVPAVLAVAGIVAAHCIVDSAPFAFATISGSITYGSWFGRRAVGIAAASFASLVDIVAISSPQSLASSVLLTLWYLILARCVCAVEAATRPPRQ